MASNYLTYTEEATDKKTRIVNVCSTRTGHLLGQIRWYGSWRQYCFYPEHATIFNVDCLLDIRQRITTMMLERGR